MRTREQEAEQLVSLADIAEIELLFLKRVRSLVPGEHRSMAEGTGFDFVGIRPWQSGDRFSSIDWAQSSLQNFAPLMVREFDQASASRVVVVADRSASTWCGTDGQLVAAVHARAIATIGLSAVFFQDAFGLITFDAGIRSLQAVAPRIGKGQVVRCLSAYQDGHGTQELLRAPRLSDTIGGYLRQTSFVPFISDFLFDEPRTVLAELALLAATHDVVVVLVDCAFAFNVPAVSAGWIRVADVETGQRRLVKRSTLVKLQEHVREWQDSVEFMARDLDLEVLRLGADEAASTLALAEFVAERRLRKLG